MFTERVKSSFATNEPIYTEEIIGLFPDYSRPQIFRFIKEAEEKNTNLQSRVEKAEEKNEMLEGCILEMSETVYQ